MRSRLNIIKIVSDISALGHRQGEQADKARDYITSVLEELEINYLKRSFKTEIPEIKSARLLVDGRAVVCLGCSFVGGVIEDKSAITSSLISSRYLIDIPNINFNPECEGVSRSNFYFAPSVAVSKKDLPAVLGAKKVRGYVNVLRRQVIASHVLVGNVKNPEKIVFAHYDSVGSGAADNASGVATVLGTIALDPGSLGNTLYVFDGNEELSYDYPTYWGHGFRVFEKRYPKLLGGAKTIIVVDCVGYDKVREIRDPRIINLAFPIKNIKKWQDKIVIVGSSIDGLMKFYHSDLDTPDNLKEGYMKEAVKVLRRLLLG